jgi:hypothetical protein
VLQLYTVNIVSVRHPFPLDHQIRSRPTAAVTPNLVAADVPISIPPQQGCGAKCDNIPYYVRGIVRPGLRITATCHEQSYEGLELRRCDFWPPIAGEESFFL